MLCDLLQVSYNGNFLVFSALYWNAWKEAFFNQERGIQDITWKINNNTTCICSQFLCLHTTLLFAHVYNQSIIMGTLLITMHQWFDASLHSLKYCWSNYLPHSTIMNGLVFCCFVLYTQPICVKEAWPSNLNTKFQDWFEWSSGHHWICFPFFTEFNSQCSCENKFFIHKQIKLIFISMNGCAPSLALIKRA